MLRRHPAHCLGLHEENVPVVEKATEARLQVGESQAARGGLAGHRERRLGGRRLPAASDRARGAPALRHLLGHGGLHPEAVNRVVPAV